MRTGAGLALICVGAILAFAVTANTSVFNIHIAGWVLMLIGLIGLLLPRRTAGWLGRRLLVRRTRTWPGEPASGTVVGGAGPDDTVVDDDQEPQPTERVQRIPVPPYLGRNPGTSRARVGLPPKPTLLDVPDRDPVENMSENPGGHGTNGNGTTPARRTAAGSIVTPGDTEVIEDLYESPDDEPPEV
ncbi:MAG TPA: hypothetical protein VGG75_35465 [Trebonia sp.]|jgi:hypothetical protein